MPRAQAREPLSRDDRHERLARGRSAEEAVAEHLRTQGWDIVGTNMRLGRLELDVVAKKADVVAVVEVRSRGPGAWTSGFGSIDAQKRLRIRRAGERLWQRRYKNDPSVNRLRFDAASVTFGGEGPKVEYVVAAF